MFSSEEAVESFNNCSVNELLRLLPDSEPISVTTHSGQPQNIDIDKHWHPLRLFKLFFDWETMGLIVKETNSYAFRNNSAYNPWKTLSIPELYHFFGCLIRLGLHKHPSRAYYWKSHGILAQVPLSKRRFQSILSNFHFKDRGLNPQKGNWWDKLDPISSILRRKCSLYWRPSTNLTVDEIMIKFEGRTTQKITIPGKLL